MAQNPGSQSNPQLKIFFLILLAASLGGGAPIFTKIGLREIPAFSFVSLRFFFASLVLLPFFLKKKPKFDKHTYKVIGLSLLSNLNILFFSFGIKLTSANIGQAIFMTVPIVSAIISYFLLKERFNFAKIFGILVGFMGIIVIFLLPMFSTGIDYRQGLLGNFLVFISALFFTFYIVLSKKFQEKYSPLELVTYFALTTFFTSTLLSVYDFRTHFGWWKEVTATGIFSAAFMGIMVTTVSFQIFQTVIKKATPVIASLITYVQPLATFVWAYFLLSEKLTLTFGIGFLLSLAGVWITSNANKGLEIKQVSLSVHRKI